MLEFIYGGSHDLKKWDTETNGIYAIYKPSGPLVAPSLRSGHYSPGALRFLNRIDPSVSVSNYYVAHTCTWQISKLLDPQLIPTSVWVSNNKELEVVRHHSKPSIAFHSMKELALLHSVLTNFLNVRLCLQSKCVWNLFVVRHSIIVARFCYFCHITSRNSKTLESHWQNTTGIIWADNRCHCYSLFTNIWPTLSSP